MKVQSNRFVVVSLFFTLLLIIPLKSFGQKNSQNLLNTKIDRNFINITPRNILGDISFAYKIPIIFEVADPVYLNERYSFDQKTEQITVKAGKLSDVLDSIIEQKPNYKWELNDGVIDFFPVEKRNPLIEKLFNTQIKSFSLENYESKPNIHRQLEAIPEVNELLKLNETSLNEIYVASIISDLDSRQTKVDLTFSNVTFKDLLNNIAKKSSANFWCIYFHSFEKEGKTYKILYL